MTSRLQTKKVLVNEFFDPITLGALGLGAAMVHGVLKGNKRVAAGQSGGTRWRAWQRIKNVVGDGSAAGRFVNRALQQHNESEAEHWHKEIVEKYPGLRYENYKQHLADHDYIQTMIPDREHLKTHYDQVAQTRARVQKLALGIRNRENQLRASGAPLNASGNYDHEPLDPSNPSMGTIGAHKLTTDPKNIDKHGNAISGTTNKSLHDEIHSLSEPYLDPLGLHVQHPSSRRIMTNHDAVSSTVMETLDAQYPEAARFRERVTRTIIASKQSHIADLHQAHATSLANSQNQQAQAAHSQRMQADKALQAQELKASRATIPSPFAPGITKTQRALRGAHKLLRNRFTDFFRTSIV